MDEGVGVRRQIDLFIASKQKLSFSVLQDYVITFLYLFAEIVHTCVLTRGFLLYKQITCLSQIGSYFDYSVFVENL